MHVINRSFEGEEFQLAIGNGQWANVDDINWSLRIGVAPVRRSPPE